MVTLINIPILEFVAKPNHLFSKKWLLLTSGNYSLGQYNAMTISWGSIGEIWAKPFIQVVVRPTRHTFGFMEEYPTFTVCAFPEEYHSALALLGSKSGRDGNKIKESGLTPEPSLAVAAPGDIEAELILECRKIYWQDLEPNQFLDPEIETHYSRKDYHRIYFGEILSIRGTDAYYQNER